LFLNHQIIPSEAKSLRSLNGHDFCRTISVRRKSFWGSIRVLQKVFCIGFHKTGTTSMREALAVLGYRVTGPNHVLDPDIAQKLDRVTAKLSHEYDAFQDNPWPLVYRQMDALHPGAKFILTLRDEDRWFESALKHFRGKNTPMRALIYGAPHPKGNETLYRERLRRHNREVMEYFKDRPDDLLVIDVTRDPSWDRLCAFLGKPVPAVPFPHANKRDHRPLPRTGRAIVKGWKRLRRSVVRSLRRSFRPPHACL
jgi:hypothetical protein